MGRAATATLLAIAVACSLMSPAGLAGMGYASAEEVQADEIEVSARSITRFRIARDQYRFGQLEFAGGLEMYSSARHFGALSGVALEADQKRFLGVADTGFWISGEIERDANRNPIGLSAVVMTDITDEKGAALAGKIQADAESIAVDGDTVLVGFEQRHRITRYTMDDQGELRWRQSSPPPVPLFELRRNRGFEGLAFAPETSALSGALIGVSEKSLDRSGNIMAFVRGPDGTFEFSVQRRDDFDITDIAFLPDGDLIILERRFNVQDGIGMRLRQIDDTAIREGATIDGDVLIDADMRHQIDNMEALDITVDPDGVPRLTILSDDNHSLLQRNLLVEFRLVSPEAAEAGG